MFATTCDEKVVRNENDQLIKNYLTPSRRPASFPHHVNCNRTIRGKSKAFVINSLLSDAGKGLKLDILSRPLLISSTPVKQLSQSHVQQQ